MGVPVALGGLVWFAVVGLLAVFSPGNSSDTGNSSDQDATGSYIFLLSTVALAAILYLGYASFVVLKHLCLFCLGTYVAVVGIFVVSASTKSVPLGQLPGRLGRDISAMVRRPLHLLAWLVLILAAVFGITGFPKPGTVPVAAAAASADATAAARTAFEKAWSEQQRVDLGISADGAKVVIVKFNDWQCPSCKASYFAYKPILQGYEHTNPGAIKYVTKDYPLSNKCNFNLSAAMHQATCEAAAFVRMARDRGKADEAIEWLFSLPDQMGTTPETIKARAREVLGVTDFDKEYQAKLPDIQRDAADGGALHVQYTPTYYVNGVKAQYGDGSWLPAEYFDYAIQYELKKADAKRP
jgi:protein-disulfide isomerase